MAIFIIVKTAISTAKARKLWVTISKLLTANEELKMKDREKCKLDEMQREERLEIQRRKKEDWIVSYWRLQEQEMTVQIRNLSLLEQAIFMEW